MATATVDYTYRYPFESTVDTSGEVARMKMAVSLDGTSDDLFFDGKLRRPALAGRMLAILSDIIRTRFYQPLDSRILDPVVTSGGGMLRFEGFSSCCGVYARVDLAPAAFDVDLRGKGTTNVDFNDTMRTVLRRLNDRDDAALQVGGTGVALSKGETTTFERKVKLPVRWIKGFCEVQAYQPRLVPQFELSSDDARRLFRSLPRGRSPHGSFLAKAGRAFRLTPREHPGSVWLDGPDRVRIFESLLPLANHLRIWYDSDAQTSGWEIETEIGRLFVLVSPERHRGFSGEGQMLDRLAIGNWESALAPVANALQWQSSLEPAELSRETGQGEEEIESALAMLAARGITGYDVTLGRYFHRVLPFDLEKVDSLQPRLKNAKQLVDAVEIVSRRGSDVDAKVPGSDHLQYVRLRASGSRCTCRWFLRYQGRRGPCKHVLAVTMAVGNVDSDGNPTTETSSEHRST